MTDKPGPMARSVVHRVESPMTRPLREVAADRGKPSRLTAELAPRVLEKLEQYGTISVGGDAWNQTVEDLGVDGAEIYRCLWNLTFAGRATREVQRDDLGRLRWKFTATTGIE